MYRIRSASGTEAVYNSLEEFTAAVRRGDVVPEDEIFHSRANRWLDVKSHPHYRSAINWSGPLSADAIFAAPAPPAPKPAAPIPAPAHPAAPRHSGGSAPPRQVAEIPATAKPAGTTAFRPQLSATPPAKPTAPASKNTELTFIEVEPTQPPKAPAPTPAQAPAVARHNATIIEAKKPPVPPAPQQASGKTSDFLVMDTGLESPVRTSSGFRAISGDADMLFDVPLSEKLPPSQAATSVAPTAVTPAPTAPTLPVAPKPVEAPAPAPVAVKPAPSPAPSTPAAAPVPALPAAPAAAVAPTPPHKAAEPAQAAPEPPKTVAAVAPARTSAPVARPVETDLDIPGAPLLESPVLNLSPASAPVPAAVSRGSLGWFTGAGALVLVVAGGLMLWHPWSRGSVPDRPSAQSPNPGGSSEVQGLPPFAGASETTATAAASARPGVPAPVTTHAATTRPAGDSTIDTAREEVIAAQPNLHALAAPTTSIDLSTDLATRESTVTAVSPADLARRIDAAERQAQQDLAARLGAFSSVLSAAQLSTPEGVTQAQGAWSAGAQAIRQYRARIARLEQAYEDSVLASQRQQHWSSEEMRPWATHQSPAEPAETSQLVDLMLNQVGEGLGLLAGLSGEYTIRDDKIRFNNPASASRYISIRTWVEQRTESWSSTPEGARPQTVNLILRALGDGFPPVE